MAIDKAIDSAQLDADLTSVADAIRTKGGTSAALTFPAGFVSEIGNIGGDTVIEKTVYTHAENWPDRASGGTTLNFYNIYFDDNYDGIQYVEIANNTITTGNYGIAACTANLVAKRMAFWRSASVNPVSRGMTTDFFLSSGSIITVYKIPKEAFPL